MNKTEKESMLMNWPERVWIYSPIRVLFQRREVREWMRLAAPRRGSAALEIGCGLGRGARLLVDHMGFSWVAAFDLEEILVRRSDSRLPAKFRELIAFFVGDAQDLPFPDASFHAVVNFGIIHHVLDWRRCISEIARVMQPDGIFYFEEIYPPLYANFFMKHLVRHPAEDRFSDMQFLQTLEQNGLHLVEGTKTSSRFGIVGAARLRA
jgi:ubiquinone/menaquinone biosynthesis C-methylase UbiE